MRPAPARLLGSRAAAILVLSALLAAPALARQFPNAECPDSLTIYDVQNDTSPCHPLPGYSYGDTLFTGIRGIVTARDTKTSGVGFWIQSGREWSGITVFTGNTLWPLALGDSVVVRPSMVVEYGGETQLVALTGWWGTNLGVEVIARSRPLPPYQEGTPATWDFHSTNTTMEAWEACRVRCVPAPGDAYLRVARVYSGAFMVVTDGCTTGICDSVYVDVTTIPNPSLNVPPLGTRLTRVQGIAGQTANGYRIRFVDEWWDPTSARPATWGRLKTLYR